MKSSVDKVQQSRRGFLKGVAVVGGGAVMVAATQNAIADTVEEALPVSPASKGYHLTPHIREYYQKARF